ncbi:MAG: hypothetical protein GF401_12960 [Chitinivibrionales bacterium]|nr:hypothetical protein [Chitinivibrionales bacterium]
MNKKMSLIPSVVFQKPFLLLFFFCWFLFYDLHAQQPPGHSTLAGDLPKSLKAANSPYLVEADIFVPSGKTVTIEPGTVLLFKNFTGVHVEGRLIASGTKNQPVTFTSEFDQTFNPKSQLHANPYDWNGVFIHKGGIGTDLAYCKILYSVYGINSETKFIRIHNTLFAQNGRSNLTIEGTEHNVTNEPYSYALSVTDATVDGVPVKILMDPHARKRNAVRYSGLTAFLGGCSLGIVFISQWNDAQNRVSELSRTKVTGASSNLVSNTEQDFLDAQASRNRNAAFSAAAFCLGALGSAGFAWSFTF